MLSAGRGQRSSVILLLCVAVLAGCASATQAPLAFDPRHTARIRVFHGPLVDLHLGYVCDGGRHPVIHAASGGFSFLRPNKTIGMPPTRDMAASYSEYVISAGDLVTVKMFWQVQKPNGDWDHCGPIHMLFTPEAGQDYDTFLEMRHGVCQGVRCANSW